MATFKKQMNNKKKQKKVKGKPLNKKQIIQIEKMITKPTEKKFYDNGFASLNITTTPLFFQCFDLVQGTTSIDRIGSYINLLNFSYKFRFVSADTTQYVRCVIFQWRPANYLLVPQWNRIFQFPVGGGVPSQQMDYMSPYILGDGLSGQFKIIKNIELNLTVEDPVATVEGYVDKGYIKKIGFNDATDLGENQIYVVFISDSNLAPHPTVSGYMRCRFTDE